MAFYVILMGGRVRVSLPICAGYSFLSPLLYQHQPFLDLRSSKCCHGHRITAEPGPAHTICSGSTHAKRPCRLGSHPTILPFPCQWLNMFHPNSSEEASIPAATISLARCICFGLYSAHFFLRVCSCSAELASKLDVFFIHKPQLVFQNHSLLSSRTTRSLPAFFFSKQHCGFSQNKLTLCVCPSVAFALEAAMLRHHEFFCGRSRPLYVHWRVEFPFALATEFFRHGYGQNPHSLLQLPTVSRLRHIHAHRCARSAGAAASGCALATA